MKNQKSKKEENYTYPIATVDVALFTIVNQQLQIVLIQREAEPYLGSYALPGGYIHVNEDNDTQRTAERILAQKVGLDEGYFLEQLATFSGEKRDPRGWSISIVYYAVVPENRLSKEQRGNIVSLKDLPPLPFDHNLIIERAVNRIQDKSTYSSLPAFLLPAEFTFTELHRTYENVIGEKLDKASFRRKIEKLIEPVEGVLRKEGAYRPSQVYRLSNKALHEFPGRI